MPPASKSGAFVGTLSQGGGAVTTFLKRIRKPFGIIVPWEEVERRVICDALDKCGGNYLLAARLLGIGRTTLYRKATAYNYRTPKVQATVLMTISQSSLTA
jgi:transcriptional regulator of acetoin/glycerol metabolism